MSFIAYLSLSVLLALVFRFDEMGLEALEVSPPTSDDADTPAKYWKTQDQYIFKPAEWFFKEIAGGKPIQPHTISCEEADQQANGTPLPVSSHGRIFRFNDKLGFLLIQFMRPQVWRIRFHSTNTTPSDFSDYNTRTIVQDTLTKTIEILDLSEGLSWHVELVQPNDEYYVLQSVLDSESIDDPSRKVIVQLWIERNPINITAIRAIRTTGVVTQRPKLSQISNVKPDIVKKLAIYTPPDSRVTVIWRTKNNPLQWLDNATILAIEKPLSAKYTSFGEQGGRRMFKDNVCMNYFSETLHLQYISQWPNNSFKILTTCDTLTSMDKVARMGRTQIVSLCIIPSHTGSK